MSTVPDENVRRQIDDGLAYLRDRYPAVVRAITFSPRTRATDYALALDLAMLVDVLERERRGC